MNFYKHHIGDYAKKTGHLSLAEHGAYALMLHTYYGTEKPLPTGQSLYRLLRATTKAEREAVDSIVIQFWTVTKSGLVNGRADEEIERAQVQREVNRETGKKGGRPPKVNRTETESVLKTKPNDNPIQTPDSRLHSQSSDTSYPHLRGAKADTWDLTERIRAEYPAGSYRQTAWQRAERSICDLIAQGETQESLLSASRLYRAQCEAKGKIGSEFVLSPANFYGNGEWRGPFPIPAKPETAMDRVMRATAGADLQVIEHDHAIVAR